MKSYVYPAATSTARALIRYIIDMMNREPERIFYFAFSGGTTPSLMFDIWAHEFREGGDSLDADADFLGGRTVCIRQRLGQ